MADSRFALVDRLEGASEWRHRDNGLTLLVWPTPVAPVVGFGIVYRVGSRHEGTGHTGATHILEHLMFKGSRRFNRESGTEIARVLHRVGASFNATTWLDRTSYYEVLPVEHLPLAVDVEADRMRGALVRDCDLESERTVVLNELEMGENEPFELLMRGAFAQAYLEHPYRHPTIGWRGDVESMTGDVLRRFYDTYYHPDNAVALVVGDIDEARALTEVGRGFGGLPPAPAPVPAVAITESEQRGERRFEIRRAGELGNLVLTWHIPHGTHRDLPALSVLAQVLADGVTSRLHRRLVETNRCLGVHAYALELHDPGVLQIAASLAPGVEHREVEDAIREEVAAAGQAPPGADELARAKVQMRTDLAFHRSSPAQILSGLTESVAMGDWRRFPRELELVTAVAAEDVARVAGDYLTDQRLTTGWFVPEAPGGGARAGSPQPRPCHLRAPFAERVAVRDHRSGARIAVLTNRHAPTVTVTGTLQAGLACAADGRWSVPGLTAAMLDRGTRRFDRMGLARELEDHGLQLTVSASGSAPTTVSFSAQALAEELPRVVDLLLEVLQHPTFPAEELEKLRERVLGALVREREETHALAYAALTRQLYPEGHPLHKRAIEAREREVLGVTCDDLAAFHAAAYGPATVALAVVGDVEANEVIARFGEAFDRWRGAAVEPAAFPAAEPSGGGDQRIEVADRPNLDVFLGHRGELLRGDPDHPAAILANACLGQSTLTSRLGLAVRDQAGLSYGIYSRFFGTLRMAGPWAISLSVAGDNLDRAVALTREVLAGYAAAGPTEEELADERLAQAGAYRVGLATNGGVARELVAALTAGEAVASLDHYPERLLEVTREEVVAAIRRHLHPERVVVAAAGTLPPLPPPERI
ncbi:MAG TPA: pitrilysin family protein [Thermoanaerobaculales bacterium]|nr:pitrilysin family protein [Thermoanaerobaculales bacterium]